MRIFAIFLFLVPLASYGASEQQVKRCEKLTITNEGIKNKKAIAEQKAACFKNPKYEICMYEGAKQYRASGALIPLDAIDEMEKNCSQ